MAVNKVILLGNLGADPELRYTANQMPVTTLRIATSDKRKDASGNWTEHTEWHSVVCFGKTAENCCQYLKKGRQVYLEGRIQTRKWQDKEGKDRYSTEVIANTVQFVGSNPGAGARPQASTFSDDASQMEAPTQSASSAVSAPAPDVAFSDDDIPF